MGRGDMAKKIALLLDYNDNYAKTVVDGVAKYSMQGRWRFITHRGVPSVTFEQLQANPADGVIGYLSPQVVQWLSDNKIPTVNVKTDFLSLPACSVVTDNVEIGRRAADYLVGKGFCRFAYTAGPVSGICARFKFEGFRDRLAVLGHACAEVSSAADIPAVFRHDKKQPLAVFAVEDFVGRMVIDSCEDCGLRVPEDIAVLGVNNSPFICSMVRPQLSSIELGAERIGYQAAALLDRLMQGEPPPAEPVVIAPENIIERRSTEVAEVEDRLVHAALEYITEHVRDPIGVADVARAAACCRRTLELKFRERLGRTPHAEIRRTRIEQACRLLRETDLTVEVVTESCGYAARDRFNAAFRKEKGMTPSHYRKQYRFVK